MASKLSHVGPGELEEGDEVEIDHDYFGGPLEVVKVTSSVYGKRALVRTGKDPFGAGGSIYRLRSDDQPNVVLEKYRGDFEGDAVAYDEHGWEPHLRVRVWRATDD